MKTLRPYRTGMMTAVLLTLAVGLGAQEAIQTIDFHSPAVNRTMKYNIVLPADYQSSQDRYPVVYLLHGLTSNYNAWGRQAAAYYADLVGDVIVVMPDGGNSWYTNWVENEGGQKNDWEDHIVVDVVGHVDANYRTIARREGRAISGLSMGGYGAITLGLKNPEMFISIGSTSGALAYARSAGARLQRGPSTAAPREVSEEDRAAAEARRNAPNPSIGIPGFSSQAERSPMGRAFATQADADAYDPFELILQVPAAELPHIYLDSGTEDGLINAARELALIMFENDIPFDFMQMPGRHNGAYWTQSIGHFLPLQVQVMRRALGERPGR